MTSAMLCCCSLPRLPKVVLAEYSETSANLFRVTAWLTRDKAPRIVMESYGALPWGYIRGHNNASSRLK